MTKLTTDDKHLINNLVKNHLLDKVLDEVILDISLEITNTELNDESRRDSLYLLTKALKEVKGKLQEYVNEIEFQEE